MIETKIQSILSGYQQELAIITDRNEHFYYCDLIEISEKIVSHLTGRSLVFVFCENSIGSLAGYLAFTFNGHVSLMLNSRQDTGQVNKLINCYLPDYLWVKSSQVHSFTDTKIVFNFKNYVLLSLQKEATHELHKDLALLLPTSGSTGSPKYVKLSKNNILANAKSIATYLKLDKSQRPITSLPMYYSFGLSIINSHLISGSTILMTNMSLLQKEFWSFLSEGKATSISGTPYHFEILDRLNLENLNKTNISVMTHAGGRMEIDLLRKIAIYCNKYSVKFFSMYGQTEATARMSFVPPDKLFEKIGSIGRPIPGGYFELVDNLGRIINSTDKTGELVYKGANVCLGYALKREDLKKGDQNFQKLNTGDLAKSDTDGFYYIVGRKSRFVKIYGNRINLDDIEKITSNIYGNCACIGGEDSIVIYALLDNDKDEIRRYVSKKIGINRRAIHVRLIAEMPRNSNGKISYPELEII
jgi:acyl-CoA synthetase (AMP-forming)/AMP-acid ligase II